MHTLFQTVWSPNKQKYCKWYSCGRPWWSSDWILLFPAQGTNPSLDILRGLHQEEHPACAKIKKKKRGLDDLLWCDSEQGAAEGQHIYEIYTYILFLINQDDLYNLKYWMLTLSCVSRLSSMLIFYLAGLTELQLLANQNAQDLPTIMHHAVK